MAESWVEHSADSTIGQWADSMDTRWAAPRVAWRAVQMVDSKAEKLGCSMAAPMVENWGDHLVAYSDVRWADSTDATSDDQLAVRWV